MSICLVLQRNALRPYQPLNERINRPHTPKVLWSAATAFHIRLLYWVQLTPSDIYIPLQPCGVVANKTTVGGKQRWRKRMQDGGVAAKRVMVAAKRVMVWNTEEGCAGLWLGTGTRSIFPCLKPRRVGNGHAAGAFRGYSTGDEGSKSGEAKLRVDFPSRCLFILGAERVSALPRLLEPGGKRVNCSL